MTLLASLSPPSRALTPASLRLFVIMVAGVLALGCSSADSTGDLSGDGIEGSRGGSGNGNGGEINGDAGGDGPGATMCGDEACDPGEHFFNCREDCDAGPFVQCLIDGCPDPAALCGESAACADAILCVAACEPESTDCAPGCAANLGESDAALFGGVTDCMRDAGCIPDGPPDPIDVDDPTLSCEGRCGEPKTGDDKCACDENCSFFGDCCEDYEALCVEGGDPELCGNGICDEGEDRETCPEDCKDGGGGGGDDHPVIACLDEACPAELAECEADEGCLDVLACIESCAAGDTDCLFACSQSGGFSMAAINLGVCGQGAGCFEIAPDEPECGDGVCDDGESADSCPDDCDDGGGGTVDVIACLTEACAAEFLACTQDPACMEVIGCLATCDPEDSGCYLGCAQQGGFSQTILDFGICAGGSGCFTGGGGGGGGGGAPDGSVEQAPLPTGAADEQFAMFSQAMPSQQAAWWADLDTEMGES
ncbi:MAG: hypothetical protein QF464_15080, partial [Myxococcota bacterium]|nr:hypothetical protein [Myxococcota bacterium]